MKTYLRLLLLFLITGQFASAQYTPVTRIYAFSQSVLPGQIKKVIPGENGKNIEVSGQQKTNYLFYADKKESETIKIIGIWMFGKKYHVKYDKVATTPVELSDENNSDGSSKITISPDAGNELIQILPGEVISKESRLPAFLKKMLQQSELILIYAWNGKTWYMPVKKIKTLQPAVSV
ncbi:MAG: hypothetical protein JSS80_00780 [Bacteroidetes bacterium]|nr:hypothetical protein [Bacteroidota bacterium]